MDRALPRSRIGANAPCGDSVQHQGRGGVEIPHDHAVFGHKISAKQNAAHFDTVFGPLRRGDRAQKGAVGIEDMRQHHIQVPLVDRHIGRLANRAAGMVQPRA